MLAKRFILASSAILMSFNTMAQKQDPDILHKVDALLTKMTLEEKVGQLNQYTGKALTGPANPKKGNLQELKDFIKIKLQPGESKSVSFIINKEKLAFHNAGLNWITEPGTFQLMIGLSVGRYQVTQQFEFEELRSKTRHVRRVGSAGFHLAFYQLTSL